MRHTCALLKSYMIDLLTTVPYLLVYKSKNFIPKMNSKVGGSSYTRKPTLSSSN